MYAIVEAVLLVSENEDESGDTFPEDFKDGKADELLDGLNRLTRLLEIYLSYYIASTEITKRLPEFSNKKYTHVLSFNYTTTYMRLYDPNKEAQYCYIHGEAKENSSLSDCNMVLGIDEYQSDCDRNNNNHYVWFKKFFQRINKETSTEYDDWCRRIEEIAVKFQKTNAPQNELFIFGHSLDVTDKDIISRFIMGRNTTTYIYYYSKDDKAKKIENLVKVIGEDNLIRKTQGSKRTIHFIKTEKAIDLSKE